MELDLDTPVNVTISDGQGIGSILNDPTDNDHDGVPDITDNCLDVPNPTQLDSDGDGRGNSSDNCPFVVNIEQTDTDGDGFGDACDNCPNLVNTDQKGDTDDDSIGDSCTIAPASQTQVNSTPITTGSEMSAYRSGRFQSRSTRRQPNHRRRGTSRPEQQHRRCPRPTRLHRRNAARAEREQP